MAVIFQLETGIAPLSTPYYFIINKIITFD